MCRRRLLQNTGRNIRMKEFCNMWWCAGMQPLQPCNVVIYSRHTAEDFASLACCPRHCNTGTSEVWTSRGSPQQSLAVHLIHQMAWVCRFKSAQTAATSTVRLAAGNEARRIALFAVAGRVRFTAAWELADSIGSVALVCRSPAQGLPLSLVAVWFSLESECMVQVCQ